MPRLKRIHELFLTHYLDCFDVGKAAVRAGYNQWYPESRMDRIGRALLRRQDVAEELETRLMDSLRGHGIHKGKVLKEICDTAFAKFDPRNLYHDDGTPRDLLELDDETASFIEGIEIEEQFSGRGEDRVKTGEVKKYKIRGKKVALEAQKLLGQHLKLFDEDNKVKLVGSDGGPPQITVNFVPAQEKK